MSKILGIDYGEKRIGLAISDETKSFARELTILSPKDFFRQINDLINQHQIGKIVLGWPLNMNGKETKKTEEVKEFKKKLGKIIKIQIETIDERLSSAMTKNLPGGKENKDSLAAKIILQNYLDKSKHFNCGISNF